MRKEIYEEKYKKNKTRKAGLNRSQQKIEKSGTASHVRKLTD